jgi:hypothetical protein
MRNEVLTRVKEEGISYIQQKERKAYWIGHSLCIKWFLKHGIGGKIEGRIEVMRS